MTDERRFSDPTEYTERLGRLADRLDNLCLALQLPLDPRTHTETMRGVFPELVTEAKAIYVGITGDDPWEGQP